jgi:hypothetical protein
MQDRPSVDELLEAVAGFLQDDVMPNTSGRISFHARVASNVLQTLRRELASEEEFLDREWHGLDGLLGEEPRPASLAATRTETVRRNERLSQRIREGAADEEAFRQSVLEHLRAVTRDKLAVSDPKILG